MLTAIFLILGAAYFAVYLIANLQTWKTTRGFFIDLVSLLALILVLLILFNVVPLAKVMGN